MNAPSPAPSPLCRLALTGLGWASVGLGMVGMVVPGLPTTPFLLVAAWAFARSSPRFHAWLLSHRLLGPLVRDWQAHGVVPPRAKAMAVIGMAAGLAWVLSSDHVPAAIQLAVGALVLSGASYVLSRPSRRPVDDDA